MDNKKADIAENKKEAPEKIAASAPDDEKNGFKDMGLLEPTRFGDWEVNGRCSDF